MLDQAEALRDMVDRLAGGVVRVPATPPAGAVGAAAARRQPPPPDPRVVAIASGKGGVGKTTLTVSLAAELVRRGRRVLVLDVDFGTANADVACGLHPEATLADVLRGTHRLADVRLAAPGGFFLIPGASGLVGAEGLPADRLDGLLREMDAVEAASDMVLLDVGAGVGPVVQAFCRAAGRLLVVTTPDPTAVTDAYALLKTLRQPGGGSGGGGGVPDHASIVVNLVAAAAEGREVHDRLEAACRHFLGFSPPLAGVIPADPAAAASVRAQVPLLTEPARSPAGFGLARLAATLDRRGAAAGATPKADAPRAGLLRRVLGR